jgi:hypothetical protein
VNDVVQALSLVGAALILGAFAMLQVGRLGRRDRGFNLLNLIGSTLLTVVALYDMRWGFIVLEAAWALLSLFGMLQPAREA